MSGRSEGDETETERLRLDRLMEGQGLLVDGQDKRKITLASNNSFTQIYHLIYVILYIIKLSLACLIAYLKKMNTFMLGV